MLTMKLLFLALCSIAISFHRIAAQENICPNQDIGPSLLRRIVNSGCRKWCGFGVRYGQWMCNQQTSSPGGSNCLTRFCQCNAVGTQFQVPSTSGFKTIYAGLRQCMNWYEAQCFCCKRFGGKLWEPNDEAEYDQVMAQLAGVIPPASASTCGKWTGMVNFDNAGPATLMRYSSTMSPLVPGSWTPPPQMLDGIDGGTQNAVGHEAPLVSWAANPNAFTDWNSGCTYMAPICEY